MLKKMMFMSVLMSSAGVPYLLSTGSEWIAAAKSYVTSMASQEAEAPAPDGALPTAAAPAFVPGHPHHHHVDHTLPQFSSAVMKTPPVEGYGAQDLAEIINFNATPAWVMSRWPRVTVGLAELDMQGYRVPLVTGTGAEDLAGSLTYYFDENQAARLIHFRGTTGDPRKIVSLVMQHFKFRPQETGDPGLQLYQVKWNGKPTSELQVRTANIIRASQPYNRYQIELAIKRP